MVQKTFKVSEVQLSFKPNYKIKKRPHIKGSEDAYKTFIEQWNLNTIGFIEEFKIILTNKKDRVLGLYNISSVGTLELAFAPKIVTTTALTFEASKLILAHNTLNGQIEPSKLDLSIANKLNICATLIDIEILDYMIINKDWYYSFRDYGIL